MTDVLGVCVSWADGRATIRREDGTLIDVRVDQIISGKPVPPKPSIRHRVSPVEAQQRAMALFPDLVTERLGEWTLRHSPTQSARRANSVLAVGSPGPEDAIAAITNWYLQQSRHPIAAVLVDSPEQALFEHAGWVPESDDPPTQFRIASVSHALRLAYPATDDVRLSVEGELAIASTGETDDPIATCVATYADDWLGLRGLWVSEDHRRQGHARRVVAELLRWGAERGARTAYLQALGNNQPALALYTGFGFALHHSYCYLAQPTSGSG